MTESIDNRLHLTFHGQLSEGHDPQGVASCWACRQAKDAILGGVLKPEDEAMRLRTFTLAVYIDHDGHEQIEWEWEGEPVTGMAALGYLEAAKLGMFHGQLHDSE